MTSSMEERIPEIKVLKRLQQEEFRPCYIFYGPERYFIRKSIEIMEQKILSQGGSREFCIFRYYGQELNVEDLVDLARTATFFGGNRLIIVVDAEGMGKKETEDLCEYLKNPCPFTCLVLICGAKIPESKYFEHLQSQDKGACVEFPRLKKDALNDWIRQIAKGKGIRLTPSLVEQIQDASGNDLEAISNEVEKISLLLEKGHEPGEQEIYSLLNFTKEEPFYLLTDALFLRRSRNEALRHLHRIIEQGYHPLPLLSWLSKVVRMIWRIRKTMLTREPLEPLARELKIRDFVVKNYSKIAKGYTEDHIYNITYNLLKTDRALKSSRLDPMAHLERLVLDICMLTDKGYKG